MGSNGKNKGKHDKGGGTGRAQVAPAKRADIAPVAPEAPAKAPAKAMVAAKAAPLPAPAEAAQKVAPVAAAAPVASAAPAAPAAPAAHAEPAAKGAAWGAPFARFEAGWTWFESRLITGVLLAQLAALVSWVLLNGLSESVAQSAGVVFRAVVVAVAFGTGTWFGFRKMVLERRRALTLVAVGLGLCLAPAWREAVMAAAKPGASATVIGLAHLDKASAGYFDNVKGWLQEGSTLTLMGGLRGLGTRLTLWLALLGGSLATASGKHIHIDVVFRFLPKKLRVPSAIINYIAAAAVCVFGAWGFFDHIAIESYGSKADDRAGAKIANAAHEISDHFFYTRKQLGLDLRSLPRILAGARYDQWMSAPAWNAWVDNAGFEGRFTADEIKSIKVPDDNGPHVPVVLSPRGDNTRGLLNETLGLVFPFGLFAIALRFLLRAVMTLSGHLSADPNEAHKEDLRSASAGADPVAGEGGV
jgi:Tripartite ATP-independent periplasmic transporters, DctQ component